MTFISSNCFQVEINGKYRTLAVFTVLLALVMLSGKGSVSKGLFHPACPARVDSWFAFVVIILMVHENGDKQRPATAGARNAG